MLESEDPEVLKELENKNKLDKITKSKAKRGTKEQQEDIDRAFAQYNLQQIRELKKKIEAGQTKTLENAKKLNEYRAIYKNLLGMHQMNQQEEAYNVEA